MRSTSKKKNRRLARQNATRKLGRRSFSLETLDERRLLAADLVSIGYDSAADTLTLQFSTDVEPGAGTGNIVVKQQVSQEVDGEMQLVNNDAILFGVNVHDAAVTFDGSTVTIASPVDLADGDYYAEIDPGAVRDTSSEVELGAVILDEDFERLPMVGSGLATDAGPYRNLDDFVVTFNGTLIVDEAGAYTFGGRTDNGMWMLLDLNQDAEDFEDVRGDFSDEMFFSDTGGEYFAPAVELEAGEYLFEFGFFERGGSSAGEFFYSKGDVTAFDDGEFVLIGDDSQGLSVPDGITTTTYKAEEGTQIASVFDGYDLRDGFLFTSLDYPPASDEFPDDVPGTPPVRNYPFADVWDRGGPGRFESVQPVPGQPLYSTPTTFNWTNVPPQGWYQDNENLPLLPGEDGIEGTEDDVPPFEEYAGWNFLNKNWWINQQGNQDRIIYTLGQGNVAVVDPDAYDDGDLNIGDGEPSATNSTFQAGLDTAPISLDGVAENSAVLGFDSSWWDEDWQSAEGRVEFFDESGESLGSTVLFRWESSGNPDPTNHYLRSDHETINEHLEFDLENPAGAASMVISFDMPYAGNDWWWAIDNIKVTGDVEGAGYVGAQDRTTAAFVVEPTPECIDGDVDCNGVVDLVDFNILKENFGLTPATRGEGDLDENGTVDLLDFNELKANFGNSAAAIAFASLDDDEDA